MQVVAHPLAVGAVFADKRSGVTMLLVNTGWSFGFTIASIVENGFIILLRLAGSISTMKRDIPRWGEFVEKVPDNSNRDHQAKASYSDRQFDSITVDKIEDQADNTHYSQDPSRDAEEHIDAIQKGLHFTIRIMLFHLVTLQFTISLLFAELPHFHHGLIMTLRNMVWRHSWSY